MACLFGHKWEGCTCKKCGMTRDQEHDYQPVKGQCALACSRCGTTQISHQYDRHGFCQKCDALSERPFDLSVLSEEELDAERSAIEIVRSTITDTDIRIAYADILCHLDNRPPKLSMVNMLVALPAIITVRAALAEKIMNAAAMPPRELEKARAMKRLLDSAARKSQDLVNELSAANEQRDDAKFRSAIVSVLQLQPDPRPGNETESEKDLEAPRQQLLAGESAGMNALKRALLACADGKGSAYAKSWWHGAVHAVRIIGSYPAADAQDALLVLLEKESNLAEWYGHVQKEAIAVLADIATADAQPRLEALIDAPQAMGLKDAIRALADKLAS